MIELGQLEAHWQEFEKRKVRVVVVSVEDDGRGFAFHGRYDLPMLERKHIGPASVKERVGLLHGQMVLNSRRTGSRVEVRLPMQRATKRSSSTSRA